MRLTKELISDKTILKIRAHQNPSTLKPGTIELASKIRSAFMTKVNKPKVRMVRGRVRRIRRGFISKLIMPKTTAVTSAAVKFATWTPGKRYAATRITMALTSQLIIIFIILCHSER